MADSEHGRELPPEVPGQARLFLWFLAPIGALPKFVTLCRVSIEEASLAVPVEQRVRFLARAALVAERARARRASPLELSLSLRVLSVLYGAASSVAHGSDS